VSFRKLCRQFLCNFLHTYTGTHTYIHTYIHTQTDTHTHTHTDTHTYIHTLTAPMLQVPLVTVVVTARHPLSAEIGTNFSNKRRPLGWYSSLAESSHRGFFCGQECERGATIDKAQHAFAATGICPYMPNIFSDYNFEPTEVTV
jgi:hypothetical protein